MLFKPLVFLSSQAKFESIARDEVGEAIRDFEPKLDSVVKSVQEFELPDGSALPIDDALRSALTELRTQQERGQQPESSQARLATEMAEARKERSEKFREFSEQMKTNLNQITKRLVTVEDRPKPIPSDDFRALQGEFDKTRTSRFRGLISAGCLG